MSSIKKLSIRGIRGFGDESRDKQTIEFVPPLTLITGHNGAGKTSVIECLRYISTGKRPPLIKDSEFIYDPKVANKIQLHVEAQVRLTFTDIFGRTATATMNAVSTENEQKENDFRYKTRDGIITCYNDRGKKSCSSYKFGEFTSQMETLLGVTKPVLTHVIFCHQEESTWPLGDGKSVKTKFDEIFAATRYRKALENMNKIKKGYKDSVNVCDAEIPHLKQKKDKAKELRDELQKKKDELSAAKDEVTGVTQELVPIEELLRGISVKEKEVDTYCSKLEKLELTKEQIERYMEEIDDRLEEPFEGSTEDLLKKHSEHQNSVEQKEDTLKQNYKQLEKTKQEVDRIRIKASRLYKEQCKLELEETQHQTTVETRNRRIRRTAHELQIPGYDNLEDSSKIQQFEILLDYKVGLQEAEVTKCKSEFKTKEAALDEQIQELRDTKTKLEHKIQMNMDSVEDNKAELRRIANDWNLEEVQASANVDELKEELQQLQYDKKETEATMSLLSEEMSALSLLTQTRIKMNMLQDEKESKENQIRIIREMHEDEMTQLMENVRPEYLERGKLSDFLDQKHTEVQEAQTQLCKTKCEMSSLEASRNMVREELTKLKTSLNTNKKRLMKSCKEGEDLYQKIERLQQYINTIQSEKGALTGNIQVVKGYIDCLELQDATCPVCHREFGTESEVDGLVQELQEKLHLVPETLDEKTSSLIQQTNKLNELMELKTVKDNVDKLNNVEIPTIKSKLSAVNSSIEKLTRTISEQESLLSVLQEEERKANELKPDIWLMDHCHGELEQLEDVIASQNVQMSDTDTNRTMQQVNSELQTLHQRLGLVSDSLEQTQQQMEDETQKVQQEKKLKEQKTELKSANKTYQREVKKLKKQLIPVQNRLSKLTRKRNEVVNQKEAHIEKLKSEVEEWKQKKNRITSLTSSINRYLDGGNKDQLESCQREYRSEQQNHATLVQTQTKLTISNQQLREELAKQQVHKRELEDNLQLRKKQKEVKKLEEDIVSVKQQLATFDRDSLKIERRLCQDKKSQLLEEKTWAQGQEDKLQGVVGELKKQLNGEIYKDIDNKYQDMFIKLTTTRIVISDIEKYCNALEIAIIRYHNSKMAEINRIIKDYWSKTYRGNDIEYIEIRSEVDENGTGPIKKYNYRVVMITGGAALDMRGRCSAGQKVLASVIIRLALAETFCLNCGILALDEPTTNLDEENITSLASALIDIIDRPEARRSIQLIVITHNENFVEQLGRFGYSDEFYRITKSNENKSIVRKENIANLQTITGLETDP